MSKAIRQLNRSKVDQKVKAVTKYLRRHHALFTFGENVGTEDFPVPAHQFKWFPTRQPIVTDLWKTNSASPTRGRLHLSGQLVHQWLEGYRMARREISLEQIA